MSKVYEISGKFQEDGLWSKRPEDFRGAFVVDEKTHVFKGCMEEKYPSPYDSQCFICGIMKETQIGYFKLFNEKKLIPLFYVFGDYQEEGMWGVVRLIMSRNFMFARGAAKVTLQEVQGNAKQLEQDIEKRYSELQGGFQNFNTDVEKYLTDLESWLETRS